MKRVITATGADGKSYFESVTDAAPQFAELRASAAREPLAAAVPVSAAGAAPLEPQPHATTWRVFELPDDAIVAQYLKAQGASKRGDADAAFHRTHTLDYVMILDGVITLELDRGSVTLGPGDCVVQRGTAHAWRNKSGKPVRMAVVMVGLAAQ
jgi:mannose-6-phosphate isomerase-like protein (cupin superfamily)